MGRSHPVTYGHAFDDWRTKDGPAHPEWFQRLENGKRGRPKPTPRYSMCVSSPDFQREIVERWKAGCGQKSTVSFVFLSGPFQNDRFTLCLGPLRTLLAGRVADCCPLASECHCQRLCLLQQLCRTKQWHSVESQHPQRLLPISGLVSPLGVGTCLDEAAVDRLAANRCAPLHAQQSPYGRLLHALHLRPPVRG